MDELRLIEKFSQPFEILRNLFPEGHFTDERRIRRLDEIYRSCEASWEANLHRFHGGKVKYLLIAEAPPWTAPDREVRYFYKTCDGAWVRRIWKTFFYPPKPSTELALSQLAAKGFLLIDSLPFAENYSKRRNNKLYAQLVESSVPYLKEKIQNPLINWSQDVKVAFAFKIHGQSLIQSLPKRLDLPTGQKCSLSNNLICGDRRNRGTSPEMLGKVFDIIPVGSG